MRFLEVENWLNVCAVKYKKIVYSVLQFGPDEPPRLWDLVERKQELLDEIVNFEEKSMEIEKFKQNLNQLEKSLNSAKHQDKKVLEVQFTKGSFKQTIPILGNK